MKELFLRILGKPIAKQRPRFYRRGKGVGTYSPQETEEGRWILEARSQISSDKANDLPFEGPISLSLYFFMPVPKAWPKYKLEKLEEEAIPHVKKPDLDNLIKFATDCLNGQAWKDDSQICAIQAYKRYDLDARTIIMIKEV